MTVRLPDSVTLCLGIGAQKAGTTWLATYFDAHPSVFMSPIKELHYFDALWDPERMGKRNEQHLNRLKHIAGTLTLDDVVQGSERLDALADQIDRVAMVKGGHAKYLEFFARRIGDQPVAAEITPHYALLSADNYREIRSLHPRVKVVFLMRNPVDRVWSAVRHLERNGLDVEAKFDKAIEWSGMRDRTDYGRTLQVLDEVFPDGTAFVEFYEGLFTEASIRRLCDFLEIPYHPAPFDTVVNRAKERTMTREQRLRVGAMLRPVYHYCHERFGDRLPERWQADLNAISQGT